MQGVSCIYITGRLSPIAHDVSIDESTYKWAETFLGKYINALAVNLDERFAKVPVVAAFSIFQLDELPNRDDPTYQNYGKDNIKQLAEHFHVSLYFFICINNIFCNFILLLKQDYVCTSIIIGF